ncbi:16S rRNA (guanine(527)-N(7))-methyltransferase RsmG [Erythrobacter sp. QSSC1-22B]|uniref:16S rRNA (guanine(527)-N(7))-methyltransferase RsmG n=1 Tax=Erythrobacter sp. QSSC1-22B TaxID=1860125 RepID=UPI001F176278|nr:16S rRNA (guanine(527)-N(7))-methyltransferase RsmG [Erythrobacter sp. QSSC1-22B]
MARLDEFTASLIGENGVQNLIAKPTEATVWQRHLADSAQLLDHVPRETAGLWLDLGAGAGFPGIVVAIMRPEWTVRLVESRNRRIEWLRSITAQLRLTNCQIDGERLELLDSFEAAVISARAFAPMPKLLDLSARFSTSDTIWLLPKGRSAAQEVESLPRPLRAMFHVEQSDTDDSAGIVVGTGKVELKP